jgi:hypothetical protein
MRAAHVGQHQPHQRAGECDDGQRQRAGLVELAKQVGAAQVRAAAQQLQQRDHHLADERGGQQRVAPAFA